MYEFITELKTTIEELNKNIEKNKQPSKNKDTTELAKLQAELKKLKNQNTELTQAVAKE